MDRIEKLTTLASKMMLTPAQATALPTVIEVSARKVEISEAKLIEHAFAKPALASYLAGICRQVTA